MAKQVHLCEPIDGSLMLVSTQITLFYACTLCNIATIGVDIVTMTSNEMCSKAFSIKHSYSTPAFQSFKSANRI